MSRGHVYPPSQFSTSGNTAYWSATAGTDGTEWDLVSDLGNDSFNNFGNLVLASNYTASKVRVGKHRVEFDLTLNSGVINNGASNLSDRSLVLVTRDYDDDPEGSEIANFYEVVEGFNSIDAEVFDDGLEIAGINFAPSIFLSARPSSVFDVTVSNLKITHEPSTVTADHTAPDAIRGVMVDDNYNIVYDLQGEAVKTLYVDGSAITIDRSDERGEVLPYDFATYGTPEYAYSVIYDLKGDDGFIMQLKRDDGATRDMKASHIYSEFVVEWANEGSGTAYVRKIYNQGSASNSDLVETDTSKLPKYVDNGQLVIGAAFDGVNDNLARSSSSHLTGDFTSVIVAHTPDTSINQPLYDFYDNSGAGVFRRITATLGDTVKLTYKPNNTDNIITGEPLENDKRYIHSITKSGGDLEVFIDEKSQGTLDLSGEAPITNNFKFRWGKRESGSIHGQSTIMSHIIYKTPKDRQTHLKMIESLKEFHQPTIYLLFTMGQSNSVCTSSITPSVSPYPEEDSNILLNMSAGTDSGNNDGTINESSQETNGVWATSAEHLNAYGAERSFARKIKGLLGRDVAIAKWSRNGKNIERWLNTGLSSSYYPFWTTWFTAAKESLEAKGYIVKPILHWNQGTADTRYGRGASYEANLTELVNEVRNIAGEPDMPVIVGRTNHNWSHPDRLSQGYNGTDHENVRNAQETVGSTPTSVWYNRDSMEYRDEHTHFTREAYEREGHALMWDAYFSKFFSY
jgi:hypothetical protein